MASDRRGATGSEALAEDAPGRAIEDVIPDEAGGPAPAPVKNGEAAETVAPGAPPEDARGLDEPWDEVAAGYEREAKALGETPAAARLWYEAGLIHEERLGGLRQAALCFQTAFKLDPTHRPNVHAARRLFTEVGNWAMVAQLLQAEADATEDAEAKAALLFERAVLLQERLDRAAEGVALLARVESLIPGRLRILKYVESLAVRGRDHARLADTYVREAEAADVPNVKTALLCAAAGLFAERLGDTERARALYEQVLELDGRHPVALGALDILLAAAGDHPRRMAVLEAQARAAATPSDAAAVFVEAARLAEETMGRADEAVGLLEEARQVAPDDPTVLSELARRYDAAGTTEPLAEVLTRLAEITEDPRALAEIHLKLGALFDHLDRSEDAVASYRKVLDAHPGEASALAALGKLYFRAGRWEDLIWTFEQEMASATDGKQRASRGFKIAEILEQRLERIDEAAQTLRKVLEESPGYLPALQALTRLYEGAGRWDDLVSLLENEVQATDDTEQQVTLLERIARVREERLGDPEGAAGIYERISGIATDHLPTVRNLARLYHRLERWPELIRILEQEADLVEDQRQVIALLHRVAELHEERLDDRDAAMAAHRKVLNLQPNYLPALKALGKLCDQTGQWQELIDMFRRELEVTRSQEHVVSLLLKMGEIYERRMGDPDKAVATYREVLDEQPDSLNALRALERLHASRGEWEAVVEIVRKQADILESPLEKALLLSRAAGIRASHQDPEQAATLYRAALEQVPDHAPALRALTRIHAAAGRWQDLAELYDRILAKDPDGAGAAEIQRRLGLLYLDRLEDEDRARACFEAVLDSNPDDTVALAALDRIHTAAGAHGDAVRTRIRLADQAGETATAAALLQSAALTCEHQPVEAVEAPWRRIYDLASDDAVAARRIELEARRAKDHQALLEVHRRQLESAKGDDLRLALAMRIGDLAFEHLGDPEGAEAAYRQALEIAPEHLPAIRGLKRVLASVERWDEVQTLLEREGETSKDPERSVALLFEAGVLREEHEKDLAAAESNYRKVLERAPTDRRAYDRLARLLEGQARHGELAEIHAWRAGVVQDPQEKAAAWLASARIHADALQDPQAGLTAIEHALTAAPQLAGALELGADLAFTRHEWAKSADLYQRRVELGGEPATLTPFRMRLALLHHEHLDAPDRATAWLGDVLETDPAHVAALRRLADIQIQGTNWAGAVTALERLADAVDGPAEKVPVLLELADVHADHRQDPDAALASLEKARSLDPHHVTTIERLGALYEARQDWPKVVEAYAAFIDILPAEDRDRAFPLYVRIAELLGGPLGEATRAVQAYRSALELRPEELPVRVALADLLSSDAAFSAQAIEEHRAILARDPFRVASYHALYKLFEASRAHDKAFCVAAILHFLKSCTEEESYFYTEARPKAPASTEEVLSPEDLASLLRHPDDSGPLAEVFTVAGHQLGRVHPPDLERLQVGKADRLTPKDGSPLRKMCDALAANLGGLEYELYRADRAAGALEAFAADPPVLVVGPEIIRRHPVKEQRFLLARVVSRMCLSTTLCAQIDVPTLAASLQATVQTVQPDYQGLGASVDADLVKRCNKSMARRARKALEEPARRLAGGGSQVDLERFVAGVARTADRAGLALCCDLEAGLGVLAAEAGHRDTDDPRTALRGKVAIEEALRFAVSDAFFRLRQRLKLGIG
jgi:cellulose synthase operon protein C